MYTDGKHGFKTFVSPCRPTCPPDGLLISGINGEIRAEAGLPEGGVHEKASRPPNFRPILTADLPMPTTLRSYTVDLVRDRSRRAGDQKSAPASIGRRPSPVNEHFHNSGVSEKSSGGFRFGCRVMWAGSGPMCWACVSVARAWRWW